VLLPLFALAVAAWACCWAALAPRSQNPGGFVGPSLRTSPNSGRPTVASRQDHGSRVALLAKGGGAAAAEADSESVEVSGFASFVVGLSLMPHVIYALVCAWGIVVNGESFAVGSYGMELISITVTIGLALWSFGSFVQRGCGLPAGSLGLLGLAEGLSYLAALALVIAAGATSFRAPSGTTSKPGISAPSVPSLPAIKAPEFKAPDIKVPSFKAPEFKAPDIKVPEFKAPAIKMPDVKVPEIKVPEVKAPAIKVPEIKVPEVKVPEVKVPELPKPAPKPTPEPEKPKPAPAPEKPKPAPEAKAPAPKKDAAPDFDALFD